MQNSSRQINLSDEEIQTKRLADEAELNKVSQALEEARLNLSKVGELKSELARLENEINEKSSRLAFSSSSVFDIDQRIETLIQRENDLTIAVSNKASELSETGKKLANAIVESNKRVKEEETALEKVKIAISVKSEELNKLSALVSDSLARLSSVENQIKEKQDALSAKEAQLNELLKKINERDSQLDAQIKTCEEAEEVLAKLRVEAQEQEALKRGLLMEIDLLKKSLEEKKSSFDASCAEKEAELNAKELSCRKRERWNEDVRYKLIRYKEELELHYKREFKDLII